MTKTENPCYLRKLNALPDEFERIGSMREAYWLPVGRTNAIARYSLWESPAAKEKPENGPVAEKRQTRLFPRIGQPVRRGDFRRGNN